MLTNLILGDCLSTMRKIPSNSIDAIITDIPYFGVVDDDWDNQWENSDKYLEFIHDCIKEFDRITKENATILMFTGRQYNRHIALILDKYFEEKRIIIWSRKRAFNNTRGKALASGYEPICYYTKGKSVFNNIKIKPNTNRKEYTTGTLKDGVSLSDVWSDIPALPHNSKEKVKHSSQKPIALMERCVSLCTNPHDTVLDPFMGSGSTGIACVKLKRNFIGIEANKEHFFLSEKRIKETIKVAHEK